MKKRQFALVLLLAIALAASGCTKEKAEQRSADNSKTESGSDSSSDANSGDGYSSQLFEKDVITVKITADQNDWNKLMKNAESKDYIQADITIDGVTYKDVGIKTKGNTSLTQVASTDSDRYSLKVNFDKYVDKQNCYGLDKLVLNNIYGDSTYLKEYMSYELFQYMEVPSSLHTFADIYVNEEHYGFYLALEDVDDSFLARNYGEDNTGIAYKPESFEMQGDFGKIQEGNLPMGNLPYGNIPEGNTDITALFSLADKNGKEISWDKVLPEGFQSSKVTQLILKDGTSVDFDFRNIMTLDLSKVRALKDGEGSQADISGYTLSMANTRQSGGGNAEGGNAGTAGIPGGQNGAMDGKGGQNGGSLGVDLVYKGDELSDYGNIFDNAITKSDETDYKRLIASLKGISEGESLEKYIDADEVLRYAAVNVFLVNLDSYFSNMGHNYVLYEDKGILSMLPWDYNLSFGTFNTNSSSDAVNYAIDTVFNNVTAEERPIIGLLLQQDEYRELYHKYLSQLAEYVTSGKFNEKVDAVTAAIDGYVKNDSTSFDGYDAYREGVETLKSFASLRAESVSGQLEGIIPATREAQSGSNALIDAASLDLSKLGGMENKGKGFGGGLGGNNRPSDGNGQAEPYTGNGSSSSGS